MNGRQILKAGGRGLAVGAAMAAAGYAALVVLNRSRYGDAKVLADGVKDSLLDNYIPEPEVLEHHQIAISAPADVVITTAKQLELLKSPVIRAIFRARELALGGEPDTRPHPTTLMEQMQSIGWVVLAERLGRRSRIRIGDATLGGGTRFPIDTRRAVRELFGTWVCEDCVDAARRSGRRCTLDVSHRDAGLHDRRTDA